MAIATRQDNSTNVTLQLTEEEYNWLHGTMQNPLHDYTPNDEPEQDTTNRYNIFNALKSIYPIYANQLTINEKDVIIFNCDEYRNGNVQQFDGHVLTVTSKGVDVLYLSGYKSRNDFITWENIIAKVDLSYPIKKLTNAPFEGRFIEFHHMRDIEQLCRQALKDTGIMEKIRNEANAMAKEIINNESP